MVLTPQITGRSGACCCIQGSICAGIMTYTPAITITLPADRITFSHFQRQIKSLGWVAFVWLSRRIWQVKRGNRGLCVLSCFTGYHRPGLSSHVVQSKFYSWYPKFVCLFFMSNTLRLRCTSQLFRWLTRC
jgi:hypothetical protein